VGALGFLELFAGDKTELAFGPIDGLRMECCIADISEGDCGVLCRSNLKRESRKIELGNMAGGADQQRVIVGA